MNANKTSSILQRLPVVLAVTAASYGLTLGPAQASAGAAGDNKPRTSAQAKPQAPTLPRRTS